MSNWAEVPTFSDRERLAIEFAERFALEHTEIGDELIQRIREHYTDAEIVELAATVGFCMGMGRIYPVLGIAHECRIYH